MVLAFYLLADHERANSFAFALLPRRFHLRATRILEDMETVVGGTGQRVGEGESFGGSQFTLQAVNVGSDRIEVGVGERGRVW